MGLSKLRNSYFWNKSQDNSLSKPNQKVEKGIMPSTSQHPPKNNKLFRFGKWFCNLLVPLKLLLALHIWISKSFTHPKDVKLDGQAINFGVASGSTTRQQMTSKSQVQKTCFFLGKSWYWCLASWSQYLYLQGKQASREQSVAEINVTSSVSSSIQYSLARNAMEIATVHKSFQMKTYFFHSRT